MQAGEFFQAELLAHLRLQAIFLHLQRQQNAILVFPALHLKQDLVLSRRLLSKIGHHSLICWRLKLLLCQLVAFQIQQ